MPFPCDECEALVINGVPCHEQGCPDAWRDKEVKCFECGSTFVPDVKGATNCVDCWMEIHG